MTASRLVIPDLAGKNVLITGGSTGIGAAVAKGFAEQGCARRDRLSFERGQGSRACERDQGRRRRGDRGERRRLRSKSLRGNRRRNDEPIRRPRRPHQQCRPDARAGPFARGERRACPGGDRSQLAFDYLGDPRRQALARASGRFHHQYDLDCGAKRRRRRRNPLRRCKRLCLDDHQGPRQGAHRQEDPRQCACRPA